MKKVFLLLGSNMGDRQQYLQSAVNLINSRIAPVCLLSSVYETQSWGKTDEPDYLNQVLSLETQMAAGDLLLEVLNIERDLGRIREEKWGSRTIDIDILFYGEEIIRETGLIIPHPELHRRRFTLEPLAEIAGDFVHPILNKTILSIKNELKDDLNVKKL
ncbi:MAG TPA: 2-amino-4-hydroxy-6-hydroxymethyldihydropteridine diphosphokinase [Mucilaginibacter sp.]|nr:2-amino-4-hydroxy-6-hydroxymethyldihydropteridine diphosphokinase [Mucilaginibacter sp.]